MDLNCCPFIVSPISLAETEIEFPSPPIKWTEITSLLATVPNLQRKLAAITSEPREEPAFTNQSLVNEWEAAIDAQGDGRFVIFERRGLIQSVFAQNLQKEITWLTLTSFSPLDSNIADAVSNSPILGRHSTSLLNQKWTLGLTHDAYSDALPWPHHFVINSTCSWGSNNGNWFK